MKDFDFTTPFQQDLFAEESPSRVVCWFSCGATSAVACKLAIAENAGRRPLVVAYNHVGWATPENGWRGEHHDSRRFLKECEEWFGHPVTLLTHRCHSDVDDVVERERYINGPRGAKCTAELKIRQRKAFARPGDLHVYGFDAGETDRAFEFKQRWPELRVSTPLIVRGLAKPDCLALLREAGIELPEMYRLGYANNNCIGCVKGAKGYWNKIRRDFPEVFERRSHQERSIGRSCIKGTFLDELPPNAARYKSEPDISCEGVCVDAAREIEGCEL